jgi:apolipoprotein N-acyltransferase
MCYEIAFDGPVRDVVQAGGRVLTVQTNNATFGRSAQTEQQLAMGRLRAVEHGRTVLVAATSGISAVVELDGSVSERAEVFTPAVLVADVLLRDDLTLATRLGAVPEAVLALAGAAAVGRAAGRRPGRDRPAGAVVVPTYDEVRTAALVERLHAAVPTPHLLVATTSPDGTGAWPTGCPPEPGPHVLHRTTRRRLGAAYVAGFRWAQERGYDVVVEMDADGSHARSSCPGCWPALQDADLVLGSRWVAGGQILNWPRLARAAEPRRQRLRPLVLGVPLHDATGGFRAYRREVLDALPLDDVASHGYCFQVDLAWRTTQAGYRVVEVPITFVERERGRSKMSRAIVAEALWR